MKIVIIKSTELGTNCWLPCCFVEGSRCDRVLYCKYPEKKDCRAVQTEKKYIKESTKENIKVSKELERKRLNLLGRKWWQL
jgi:hypothetical protein